jgi:hypothetical protein
MTDSARATSAELVTALAPFAARGVLLLIAFEAPVVGVVAGVAAGVLILFADLGIFVGALIGGLISQNRRATAGLASRTTTSRTTARAGS